MIVAGLVTILFKRLGQPLVLGYIVAGFLAGPHMPYMPTVSDMESVEMWSQIGVIFMMFALGLEFSFKKIVRMGFGPVIAAVCIMVCMMSIGSSVGWLFGWSQMTRLFLGGMLAMSSTTIIYKAFDDMGLQQKKFAKTVMSVLILEDILGIVLMVVLSALAASKKLEGTELLVSLFKLGFILSLWFIVGIFIVPLFLKKNSRYINSETLLIVSVGLCFLLVVLASKAGYSPAFGAFMMGSILAETMEAERIEKAVKSVKDLFGAIFFVSVGMLVDPTVLVQYWPAILALVFSIIIGQTIFGSISFIVSGSNLRDGIQSGFSMAQIGEFAFIIAGLGISLGVTERFLYPVVVAVSIITTFLTPYMIRLAPFAYRFMDKTIPQWGRNRRHRQSKKSTGRKDVRDILQTAHTRSEEVRLPRHTVWRSLLAQLVVQTAAYMIIAWAIILISLSSLLPLCRSVFTHWPGNAICGVTTLLVLSPLLRAVVMRKNHSLEFLYLRRRGLLQRLLLWLTIVVRFLIGTMAVYHVFDYLSPYWWPWHVMASMAVLLLMIGSRRVKYWSIRIERTFRHNLNRRDRALEMEGKPNYARRLHGRDLHIVRLTLPDNTAWAGRSLMDLAFGSKDGIIVVAVLRGSLRINLPEAQERLFPRDIIEVVGDDTSIESFSRRMTSEVEIREHSMAYNREKDGAALQPSNAVSKSSNGTSKSSNSASKSSSGVSKPSNGTFKNTDGALRIERIKIEKLPLFVGRRLADCNVRTTLQGIIIGIEMEDGSLASSSADYVFRPTDVVWVVK